MVGDRQSLRAMAFTMSWRNTNRTLSTPWRSQTGRSIRKLDVQVSATLKLTTPTVLVATLRITAEPCYITRTAR